MNPMKALRYMPRKNDVLMEPDTGEYAVVKVGVEKSTHTHQNASAAAYSHCSSESSASAPYWQIWPHSPKKCTEYKYPHFRSRDPATQTALARVGNSRAGDAQ